VGCLLAAWWLGDAQPLARISLQQVIISNNEDMIRRISKVEMELLEFSDHLPSEEDDLVAHITEQQKKKQLIRRRSKLDKEEMSSETTLLPVHSSNAYPCQYTSRSLPPPPSQWPQAPVLLRPTPNSHTKIRGIRYASSLKYETFPGLCSGCMLPVNTGKERPGRSMVVDFETPFFVGTLLTRIRDAPRPRRVQSGEEDAKNNDDDGDFQDESYFDNKKRRFQVVIRGRFVRQGLRVGECFTGQAFDRPAGALPARWIVHAFVRFVSALAPQLEVTFGDQPRFLTPLVATAHTVQTKEYTEAHPCQRQEDEKGNRKNDANNSDKDGHDSRAASYYLYPGSTTCEEDMIEPQLDDPTNILSEVPDVALEQQQQHPHPSLSTRLKVRKKVFGSIAVQQSPEPKFRLDKEYTFEFFQHLLLLTDEDDFKIDALTSTIGLSKALDGQPIKILAAHKDPITADLSPLWSFDIWHSALYPYAKKAADEEDQR